MLKQSCRTQNITEHAEPLFIALFTSVYLDKFKIVKSNSFDDTIVSHIERIIKKKPRHFISQKTIDKTLRYCSEMITQIQESAFPWGGGVGGEGSICKNLDENARHFFGSQIRARC